MNIELVSGIDAQGIVGRIQYALTDDTPAHLILKLPTGQVELKSVSLDECAVCKQLAID